VTCVTVVTVIGFSCGVFFPGRFTAPLAAVGVFVLYLVGFREVQGVTAAGQTPLPKTFVSAPYALLSPDTHVPFVDAGVYYHTTPDLAITQVMFMGGIAVGLFGVLGLARGDGRLLRAVAAILVACGVAAAATAFSLTGTAVPDGTGGWEIPALSSAAGAAPLPVLENCTAASQSPSGFQACVHPAFDFYLDDVAAALDPVAAEIAGLPGAPVRAEEVASVIDGQQVQSSISGNPPTFRYTAENVGNFFGAFQGAPSSQTFQLGLLETFLTGRSNPASQSPFPILGPAQLAVEDALMTAVGTNPGAQIFAGGQPDTATTDAIFAAAARFERQSAGARHAWLAAHLAALRAGAITLAQLP
jgi:hypothetical protein